MAITTVDLVGNSRPVVTPAATAQMAQAVRDGTISLLDIMDRVDARTKAKQELELVTAEQGIAEATDPQLIEAKRNVQLAEGATAAGTVANAPLAQKAKDLELKAAIYDAMAKPGGFDLMQTALSKAGFPVSIDLNQGLTDANRAEIVKRFSALDEYTKEKTQAEDRVANTKSRFEDTLETTAAGTTKKTFQRLFHNEQEVTGDQLKTWAQKNEAIKKTPFSSWYSLRSGQASQPAQPAPVVTQPSPLIQAAPPGLTNAQQAQIFNPAITDAQRAQMFNAATVAPVIQPTVAAGPPAQNIVQPALTAPVAAPPIIQPSVVGQIAGQTMVTGFTPAPALEVPKPVQMSSEQQKGLAQAALTNLQIQDLSKSLETMITNSPGLTGPIQGRAMAPFSPENWDKEYGNFVRAQTAILANLAKGIYHETGVLSDQDIERYKKALPSIKDTPAVAREKLAGSSRDIYNSILTNIETMKGQGQVASPIIEAMQKSARDALAGLAVPTAGTPPEQTVVVGGRTYVVRTDSTGAKRYFMR